MARGRAELIDRRGLSLATLARQLLLERAEMPAIDALEHLVGMQAQAPHAPYVGLWTRLAGFGADELSELIRSREAVRAPLMRATLHLVSARDWLILRPIVQPVLERSFASAPFDIDGVDPQALIEAGRSVLAERPRTRVELAEALAPDWPEHDPTALAYAVTYLLPVVQVPPRGVWGARGAARWAPAETWLGRELEADCPPQEILVRYLAAFGPATLRDFQTWSGLTGAAAIVRPIRGRLRAFRDEHDIELLDLPDAPRPGVDVPTPPRFLPAYDNVLLSHADRSRFISAGERVPLPPGNGARDGTLLADGMFAATWRIESRGGKAILHIRSFARLPRSQRDEIAAEGERLVQFVLGDMSEIAVEVSQRVG